MLNSITFCIPGEPKGKGRPRFTKPKGADFVKTYTPDATASYENLVKVMYLNVAGQQKLEGPLKMEIAALFPIPKSKSKKVQAAMRSKELLPTVKCDVDNIAKIIMDALNKVAFDDDKQIVMLYCSKSYDDNPRVVVNLYELREKEKKQ